MLGPAAVEERNKNTKQRVRGHRRRYNEMTREYEGWRDGDRGEGAAGIWAGGGIGRVRIHERSRVAI